MQRETYLRQNNLEEIEICWDRDKQKEYWVDVVDLDHREPGGIYTKRVYLPDEIQLSHEPYIQI